MDFEQIKKIIESSHLNFLIGSGASMPFLGTLGTIEQLLTDLSRLDIDEEKRTVIEASIKKHYFDVAIKGNLDLWKEGNDDFKKTNQAYQDFLQAINIILHKRKSNLISKQVNIFTTNIDLFLEKTIEENQFTFNDGFSGRLNPKFGTENFHNTIRKTSTHYEYQSEVPLFNIFKLHGSLNWKLDVNTKISYDYGLSLLNQISESKYESNDFMDITCADCGRTFNMAQISEKYDDELLGKTDGQSVFLECYSKLVMINPTKEKFSTTTKDLTFYELLRMYSNHLERENSVLFVIGFSFADEHIREITKRVSVSNPTLLIVIFAFNQAAKESICKLLPERSNIVIECNDTDKQDFTLQSITNTFFKKLANQLKNTKPKPEIEKETERQDEK